MDLQISRWPAPQCWYSFPARAVCWSMSAILFEWRWAQTARNAIGETLGLRHVLYPSIIAVSIGSRRGLTRLVTPHAAWGLGAICLMHLSPYCRREAFPAVQSNSTHTKFDLLWTHISKCLDLCSCILTCMIVQRSCRACCVAAGTLSEHPNFVPIRSEKFVRWLLYNTLASRQKGLFLSILSVSINPRSL